MARFTTAKGINQIKTSAKTIQSNLRRSRASICLRVTKNAIARDDTVESTHSTLESQVDLTPTGLSVPREALPIRVPSTRGYWLHSYTRSIGCVVNPETVIVSKLALRSCPGLCSSIHCRHVSALCGPCSRFRWGSLCRGCSATRLIARPVQVHNRWKLLRPLPIAKAK